MGSGSSVQCDVIRKSSQVVLCDKSQSQLALAKEKLAKKRGAEKLSIAVLDLSDRATAVQLMSGFDAVVTALPKSAIGLGIRTAVAAKVPLVDLSWPPDPEVPELKREVESAGALVILGCGVEPGLTEIMAHHLAEKLDRVDELHIKCGGIPEKPTPPLGYKIVFGGKQMPLRDRDGYCVENGQLITATRYGNVESVTFSGVGECEAWDENFMPWAVLTWMHSKVSRSARKRPSAGPLRGQSDGA
jgi:saccharopine dehydrogenase-like NADP-dependent oxidoreductase